MKVMLVGVSGKAGHGKDTLSDIIFDSFEKDIDIGKKIYFAGPLKNITQTTFDVEDRCLWDEKGKEEPIEHLNGLTGGDVLQKFGEAVRLIHPDMWVYHYLKTIGFNIAQFSNVNTMIICTPDVRHVNEFNAIKNCYKGKMPGPGISFKSMLVRVIRPEHKTKRNPSHPSEIALDSQNGWDHIVVAKNIGQLTHAVSPIVTDIKEYFNM